jgi:hypothetical protein
MNRHIAHITRPIVVAVLLVVSLFGWGVSPAFACDFMPPPPPVESMEAADAVFSGEVTQMDERGDDDVDRYYDVHFAVDRVWKGVSSETVVVETHVSTATCGYPFEAGETYLVYAHDEGDTLVTYLYDRTTLWENAEEELVALGEGSPVEPVGVDDGAAADEDPSASPWLLAGMLGVVSVLFAVVIVIRRAKAAGDEEDWEQFNRES